MTDTDPREPVTRPWPIRIAPGLGVAVAIAALASVLGAAVPVVGAPVFGIVLGVVAAATIPGGRSPLLKAGLGFASKPVLQLSIVVLGTGLSLQQVVTVSGSSLPVMLGTLAVALAGGWLLGRWLNVRGDTQTLIAVGTGICGASAIAATTAVIKAKESDVAYAIGTIFTFNIAAVLLFPPVGHLLGLSPESFGLWSGTAINDTSSVVAASFAYDPEAGAHGIVVKLTRTLTLIPIIGVLAVYTARKNTNRGAQSGPIPWRRLVPLFLLGFLAAAGLQSLGVIPAAWQPGLSAPGTFLITTALAGIGASLRLSDMRKAGYRPLLLGAILWVAVALSSLGLQALTGTL